MWALQQHNVVSTALLAATTCIFLLLERVHGAGESRPLTSFHSIDLYGPFVVTVTISNTTSPSLTLDTSDIPADQATLVRAGVQTTVVDKSLRLAFKLADKKSETKYAGRIRINVTATTELSSFQNSGSGSLTMVGEPMRVTSISLISQGLATGTMSVLAQTDNFNAVTYGDGGVVVVGKCQVASFTVTKGGSIDAGKLEARTATAAIYGAGNVTCNALNMLNAMTQGAGNVFYRGPAKLRVIAAEMSTGKVQKLA